MSIASSPRSTARSLALLWTIRKRVMADDMMAGRDNSNSQHRNLASLDHNTRTRSQRLPSLHPSTGEQDHSTRMTKMSLLCSQERSLHDILENEAKNHYAKCRRKSGTLNDTIHSHKQHTSGIRLLLRLECRMTRTRTTIPPRQQCISSMPQKQ